MEILCGVEELDRARRTQQERRGLDGPFYVRTARIAYQHVVFRAVVRIIAVPYVPVAAAEQHAFRPVCALERGRSNDVEPPIPRTCPRLRPNVVAPCDVVDRA